MQPWLVLAVATLACASAASAYGPGDRVNDAGSTVRPVVEDELRFLVYGFYGQPATNGHHYKVGFENGNRTWFLYEDKDNDYRHDGEAEPRIATFHVVPIEIHGNGTDHVLVLTQGGISGRAEPSSPRASAAGPGGASASLDSASQRAAAGIGGATLDLNSTSVAFGSPAGTLRAMRVGTGAEAWGPGSEHARAEPDSGSLQVSSDSAAAGHDAAGTSATGGGAAIRATPGGNLVVTWDAIEFRLVDASAASVALPESHAAGVCPGRATEGIESAARGLRCDGDLDRDGTGDFEEAVTGRNPVRTGSDRLLPTLP